MAVSTYGNESSNSHDLHITLNVYRSANQALGWTALGIGSGMAQSLSFIVYGDPRSRASPVLSVRRSDGHWEPSLFDDSANKGGIRVELVEARWDSSVARVSIICYSCDSGLDPDLEPLVSTSTRSQPWIWAKNTEQRLSEYSEKATLEMHSLKVGWGSFFVDMAHTLGSVDEAPSMPTIRPDTSAIGASETKGESAPPERHHHGSSPSSHTVKAALHGFLMALAFLLLLPCGVLAMLSGHPKAFHLHWVVQVAAMACISVGFVMGLFLRGGLNTTHQLLGLGTVFAIGVQAALGFSHHVQFLRIRRRTWMARTHIHLGRVVLFAGYCSVLTGLLLHGSPVFQFVVIGIIVLVEVGWIIGTALRGKPKVENLDGSRQSDTYHLLKDEVE
ncbi:hypothetical protein B0H67DRAFT_588617 [Lasiosphaeris hirsuta]|uniref:Cytochrome b561 domain-containing protein n=1 Tax=Lasiosphaeris hirsuta TaxID=260670 RepID=A0AA40DL82_9PEZI|nr:hypothetical protein B0H67DRAFT_588617 [Lasiosphaeris hirsuta]